MVQSEASNLKKPNKTRRERQRLITRERIIAAATQRFAAQGFEGTALPPIAEECGLRVSLILYHFTSKAGLWRACVDDVFARLTQIIDHGAADITAAEGMDYFRLAVKTHIKAAAAMPEYHRILFQEAMQDTSRLRWIVDTHQRAMTERILEVIERAQMSGVLPADADPMHLKFVTSGMFTLPISFAPEYRLMSGEDALSDTFIDRHIELCLELLIGKTT